MIRPLDPDADAAACDAIVRGLPAWFGLEEGIAECTASVRADPGLVAVEDGEVAGFVTSKRLTPGVSEIAWIAVRADRRGTGIGQSLLDALEAGLPAEVRWIAVKTLSDRDGDPGEEYRATRAFYLASGFRPVAELDLWGPENPCQLLARPVGAPA